jgi:hypothetical protein
MMQVQGFQSHLFPDLAHQTVLYAFAILQSTSWEFGYVTAFDDLIGNEHMIVVKQDAIHSDGEHYLLVI